MLVLTLVTVGLCPGLSLGFRSLVDAASRFDDGDRLPPADTEEEDEACCCLSGTLPSRGRKRLNSYLSCQHTPAQADASGAGRQTGKRGFGDDPG